MATTEKHIQAALGTAVTKKADCKCFSQRERDREREQEQREGKLSLSRSQPDI